MGTLPRRFPVVARFSALSNGYLLPAYLPLRQMGAIWPSLWPQGFSAWPILARWPGGGDWTKSRRRMKTNRSWLPYWISAPGSPLMVSLLLECPLLLGNTGDTRLASSPYL